MQKDEMVEKDWSKEELFMRRYKTIGILSAILVLSLTGCAGNPEKSVVREKNMDKMLQEAEEKEDTNSFEQVKEEVKQYESYQTKIQDKDLNVTVDVDAKVEIPEVDQLSVYRASQKKIDQKFLDRVRNALTPNITYYDGNMSNARTKSVIAKEIRETERLKASEDREGQGEESEYDEMLADLRKEYKKAPDKVTLTDYPTDHKIQEIQKQHKAHPENTFFEWLYSLHGDGKFFYGVSDGKDGNYHSLFMQNSADYGNCVRYFSNRSGYAARIYHADVEDDFEGIVPVEAGKEPNFSNSKGGIEIESDTTISCVDNEPLTLSEEEARRKADTVMEQVGLTDYEAFAQGMYAQMLETEEDSNGGIRYRRIYRFLYLRKLDGVLVDNRAGFKLADEWQGKEYVKKMWGSEAVAVAVNDSGIVGFYYLSPLNIKDTVVGQSRIKSFQEIKETFEQMVVIKNTAKEVDEVEDAKVSVKVTDVRLVYTRISEKDSFDTGLIVPVWNFEGSIVDAYGEETTGTVLSINAIDGSVIDYRLGY